MAEKGLPVVTSIAETLWPTSSSARHPSALRAGNRADVFGLTTRTQRLVLAFGGELKAAFALYHDTTARLSRRNWNLTDPMQYRSYRAAIERLVGYPGLKPELIAHDLHPNYLSTRLALQMDLPAIGVQHHHAHVVSVMAERRIMKPVIGICCDGVGLGTDHAAWGCEILYCRAEEFKRLGHLDYFPLLGGDAAAIETWRPALALVQQAFGEEWRRETAQMFDRVPGALLNGVARLAQTKLPVPQTSSLGRVFDGVSFLLGLCDKNENEAQAAIALEKAARDDERDPYPYETRAGPEGIRMSLAGAVRAILHDVIRRTPCSLIASRFHETVARMLASTAVMAAEQAGVRTIVLAGGCFANVRLRSRVMALLQRAEFQVVVPKRVPMGDAGLALGQAVIAAAIHERTG